MQIESIDDSGFSNRHLVREDITHHALEHGRILIYSKTSQYFPK